MIYSVDRGMERRYANIAPSRSNVRRVSLLKGIFAATVSPPSNSAEYTTDVNPLPNKVAKSTLIPSSLRLGVELRDVRDDHVYAPLRLFRASESHIASSCSKRPDNPSPLSSVLGAGVGVVHSSLNMSFRLDADLTPEEIGVVGGERTPPLPDAGEDDKNNEEQDEDAVGGRLASKSPGMAVGIVNFDNIRSVEEGGEIGISFTSF
jgi:hypothetical protein